MLKLNNFLCGKNRTSKLAEPVRISACFRSHLLHSALCLSCEHCLQALHNKPHCVSKNTNTFCMQTNQQSWFNQETSCCFKLAHLLWPITALNMSVFESTSHNSGCTLCRKEAPIIATKTKKRVVSTQTCTFYGKDGKNQIKWSTRSRNMAWEVIFMHAQPFSRVWDEDYISMRWMFLSDLNSNKSKNSRDSVPPSEIGFTWCKTHRRAHSQWIH